MPHIIAQRHPLFMQQTSVINHLFAWQAALFLCGHDYHHAMRTILSWMLTQSWQPPWLYSLNSLAVALTWHVPEICALPPKWTEYIVVYLEYNDTKEIHIIFTCSWIGTIWCHLSCVHHIGKSSECTSSSACCNIFICALTTQTFRSFSFV